VGPDGRFGYPQLDLYWTEPDRHAFLVKVEGKWAGFAFVKKSGDVWDMAEFFILRAYRKRGIGREVAHNVLQHFPGTWQVRVLEENPALEFWRRTLPDSRSQRMETNGRAWHVFSFTVRP
jgi:predicted acetyltransferase